MDYKTLKIERRGPAAWVWMNRQGDDAVVEDTARRIATLRASREAKEGLNAFLEKRPAAWVPVKG